MFRQKYFSMFFRLGLYMDYAMEMYTSTIVTSEVVLPMIRTQERVYQGGRGFECDPQWMKSEI